LTNHYRSHLGLSLSEEAPFEGTIRENITFGDKNISDKRVFWAMDKVGLGDFIKRQPNGLNTILYPEGKKMSYTITKKIVLARAIAKAPKLLILEDALDQFNNDETNQIIDFITDPSNPWALVVVSSNMRWQKNCEQVIQLEKGKIKL
jgi:ABC-type bacteriocin/lantibiotic exporter with double-glycine peptidase domain